MTLWSLRRSNNVFNYVDVVKLTFNSTTSYINRYDLMVTTKSSPLILFIQGFFGLCSTGGGGGQGEGVFSISTL